jgi:hypothetical protein
MSNHEVLFVYVSNDLADWLREYAEQDQRKLSNLIRKVLEDFKKEKERVLCTLPQ